MNGNMTVAACRTPVNKFPQSKSCKFVSYNSYYKVSLFNLTILGPTDG